LFTALEIAGSAEVTLVSEADHFLFTPMLYEYLSGEVEAWHIAPRYDELLDDTVRVVQSYATSIDLEVADRFPRRTESLNYDVLVLASAVSQTTSASKGAKSFLCRFRKLATRQSAATNGGALDRIPPDMPPQDVAVK
jgi:NADH dehydrogenase